MQRRSSCAKSVMIRRARACPVARGRPVEVSNDSTGPRLSRCARTAPALFTYGLRQLFQLLLRGVVDVILFSRGFGHARLIHFLFDPREKRLVGFLSWLVLMHTCTMSRVQKDYRSIENRADNFGIVVPAEQS